MLHLCPEGRPYVFSLYCMLWSPHGEGTLAPREYVLLLPGLGGPSIRGHSSKMPNFCAM